MYKILVSKQALKNIEDLPEHVKKRMKEAINTLSQYPIPVKKYDIKKIAGEERTYRIRIGKYRLIYEIYGEEIHILGISHRKKAYRNI